MKLFSGTPAIPQASPSEPSNEEVFSLSRVAEEEADSKTTAIEPAGTESSLIQTRVISGDGWPNSSTETDKPTDQLATATDEGLPVIKVVGGEIPRVLDDMVKLLGASGRFFSNGTRIVCIQPDLVTGDAAITEASTAKLSVHLSSLARWLVPVGNSGEWKRVDAPEAYCQKLLRMEDPAGLPPLAGIARQPFLRADGSLCASPGYDAQSRLYAVFKPAAFALTDNPDRQAAVQAADRLIALLQEFPFASPTDRAAALAAILTAAIRPSLDLAPMFLVTAPSAGTGKSLLCEIFSTVASPRTSTPLPFPASDTECEKVLHAELRKAPAVIFFDNLGGDLLPHDKLCGILTSDGASGRTLGASQTVGYSTRTLLVATGNNVRVHKDMRRRCVTIKLDARTEMPAAREFVQPDLARLVRQKRSLLVADALTIIRAWLGAGTPETKMVPLASYGEWSRLCRQPLLWLGQPDPAGSVFQAMRDDPDRELLQSLLHHWHLTFGDHPTTVSRLVETAKLDLGEEGINQLLTEISDSDYGYNTRRIGRWVARHDGQIAGGLRLERARRTGHAESWRVVSV